MESKTILTFYFLFGKCFLATSSDLPTKALEPLLKNHCTILLLDIPSPFIQSLQNAYQFEHHKATFLVQDSQTVGTSSLSILAQKIAPLRSCYIGISYIDKINRLHEVLLRTHNRVLLAMQDSNSNQSLHDFDLRVKKKHHPIAVLESKLRKTILHLICHNRKIILSNVRDSGRWIETLEIGGMAFERMCNHGRHPLHGKSLSVQCNSIFPHAITTPSGEITGGIIIEVLDALAWKLGFTYQISYDSSAYTLKNGTVAGAYGKVLLGQSDFATWLPSASPSFGGERSPWLFAEAYILVERTPQPLPQNLNLLYTFDLLTWVGFYSTFVLVSVVACGLSQLGMPELPPKELYLHIIVMNFGIVFQEFHLDTPRAKLGRVSSEGLRLLWVVVSTLLMISFQSILRASLISKNYDTPMKSLDDIIKREAKFHMPRSLNEQLNVLRDVSPTSKHIVELAEKHNTIYELDAGNLESILSLEEEFRRQGGASYTTATAGLFLGAMHNRAGRELPGIEIVDQRLWVFISFFFRKYDPRATMFQDVAEKIFDSGLSFGMYDKVDSYSGVKLYTAPEDIKLVVDHFFLLFVSGVPIYFVCILTLSLEIAQKRYKDANINELKQPPLK